MPPMTPEKRYAYKATTSGRAKVLISNAKQRCREKNVEISIGSEWVEQHLKRGTCELTGLPFDFGPPTKGLTRLSNAPSLDRINKHKPYTEENTRVILWAVNCALAEYGTEVMLPILKAMVKGIEDAQAKSTASLPAGHYSKSEEHTKHGALLTAGTREDHYDLDHYQRTVSGEDSDYRTQTRGGDSVAHRNKKVEPLEGFTRLKDNGEPDAEIVRLDFGRRHLSD
jgi:hypothetical protein